MSNDKVDGDHFSEWFVADLLIDEMLVIISKNSTISVMNKGG